KEAIIFYDAIELALQDKSLRKQRKEKLLLLKETSSVITQILRGRYSNEERNAYQDIYNTLDKLVLKSDDNDYESLSMEVIDITSEWASKLKDTIVNFAKGEFSKKLELEEDVSMGRKFRAMKEIFSKHYKVFDWNKNQSERDFLTQVIEPLLSVALDDLPVDVICILKGELQNRANQEYKSANTKASAIGDQPDIIYIVKISEKALELFYIKSERCITTEKKVSSDPAKLICLCKGGYNFVTTQK
ncbi:13436_t:CDS:2, partial [Racocetra persica]